MENYKLGKITITRGVVHYYDKNSEVMREVNELIIRHSNGDWGDVNEEEKLSNEKAMTCNLPTCSKYQTGFGKVLIITDDDINATTIMLDEEFTEYCFSILDGYI